MVTLGRVVSRSHTILVCIIIIIIIIVVIIVHICARGRKFFYSLLNWKILTQWRACSLGVQYDSSLSCLFNYAVFTILISILFILWTTLNLCVLCATFSVVELSFSQSSSLLSILMLSLYVRGLLSGCPWYVPGLFNDAVSSSEYSELHHLVMSEQWLRKNVGGNRWRLIWGALPLFSWRDWDKPRNLFGRVAFAGSRWTCGLPSTERPDWTAVFGVLDDVSTHNSSSSRRNRCPVNQFRAELMQPRIATIDTGRTFLCLCNISLHTYMCTYVYAFKSCVSVLFSFTRVRTMESYWNLAWFNCQNLSICIIIIIIIYFLNHNMMIWYIC